MNWASYEEVVKYIYEQLGRASDVNILGWGSSCKVTGKSGVPHQLDVLTEHQCGLHSYKTAIECKFWNNKVQKDTVTKLAEILEDAQIEKGVIVSKSGFTPDAIAFAKYKNVSLVELREPNESDWEGRIKNVNVNLHIQLPPQIEDFQLTQKYIGLPSSEETQIPLTSDCVFVIYPDSTKLSLSEVVTVHIGTLNWHEREVIPCEIIFPENSQLVFEGQITPTIAEKVTFKARKVVVENKIEIRGEDYIVMIMNCLFENKNFVLTKDGQVRETGSKLPNA